MSVIESVKMILLQMEILFQGYHQVDIKVKES